MRPLLIAFLLCLGAGLAGCARFPELEAVTSEAAKQSDRPLLADNRVVLDPAGELLIDEETQAEMSARADAMAARAEAAAGPVVPPEEAAVLHARADALRDAATRVAEEN